MLGQSHAAPAWCRCEVGLQIRVFERLDKPADQFEVHPTDEVGVVLGERVKGAVDQADVGAFVAGVRTRTR